MQGACLLGVVGVMGVGLVKSYSRGAWAGAAAGLVYLGYLAVKAESRRRKGESGEEKTQMPSGSVLLCWAMRRRCTLAMVSVSVGLLAFWSIRHSQGTVARRAYSLANPNDFSRRNRLLAYEGALQMVAERPWFGLGWNQSEAVYGEYYRAANVDQEGAVVQLNDYLMLGTTLGVPALACFGVYLWLVLVRRLPMANGKSQMTEGDWLKAVCRAGAVVLLVGFWFDGGLFELATGATFWILLELGRQEPEPVGRV